jgi:hypothetical protein
MPRRLLCAFVRLVWSGCYRRADGTATIADFIIGNAARLSSFASTGMIAG